MDVFDILTRHYESHDEEGRLLSKHGSVEYITTQKYIHACAEAINAKKILEIGAGTGRYSVPLAKEGFDVTAVELVAHNLDILKQKLDGSEPITALQGNALDLSCFADNSFDMTLLLGPMYHLFTWDDKVKALSEAVRVTKPGGFILVAYCMNEATIINFGFRNGNLQYILENNMLLDAWHCRSEPKEIFELYRTEDIAALDAAVNVTREKLVATDGATNYMGDVIDGMDDFTFEKWVGYHLATCERQDLVGASHHTLDILRKKTMKPYEIIQIGLADYPKCNAIWNMQTCPYTDLFIEQIKSGSRDVFILTVGGEYIATCDLVYDNPEYETIPGERLYFSRLIVRKEQRGKGYGEAISLYLLNKAKEKGYKSVALGVDCDNTAAVHLYKNLGFSVYEECEDKDGRFYRMEKRL